MNTVTKLIQQLEFNYCYRGTEAFILRQKFSTYLLFLGNKINFSLAIKWFYIFDKPFYLSRNPLRFKTGVFQAAGNNEFHVNNIL